MKSNYYLLLAIVGTALAYTGCSEAEKAPTAPPVDFHVHGQGWLELASPNFHGNVLEAKDYITEECQQCHGNKYDGGLVEVSCRTCHQSFPHNRGWRGGDVGSHAAFLQTNDYRLSSCQRCHGSAYDEVKSNLSCKSCHTSEDGPEACNTCHGDFDADPADLRNSAPPGGLNNETATTTPAVGMHQAHLGYYEHTPVEEVCQECHAVPSGFAAVGHIDGDGRAEVLFNGALAHINTEGGARVPDVSYGNGNTCSEAYCHGNWGLLKSTSTRQFMYAGDKIEGNAAAPVWTDVSTGQCGSCHDLPPKGHNAAEVTACGGCHDGVTDATGAIADSVKHNNGMANVFGAEFPMF